MEALSGDDVRRAVSAASKGIPGVGQFLGDISQIVTEMLPAMEIGQHRENADMLRDLVADPCAGELSDSQVKLLCMDISRELSDLANGESREEPDAAVDERTNDVKEQPQSKKPAKNTKKGGGKKAKAAPKSKIKIKGAAASSAASASASNRDPDGIPVWLSGDSKKQHVRDVNISIRMSNLGGGTNLIEKADLILTCGRKYGLIGQNGIGKSTLLHHISGYLFPDFPKNLHVMHVEQEIVGDETKVIDYVIKSDKELSMLLARQTRLEEERENGEMTADQQDELEDTYSRLKQIDSDTAAARAAMILAGLGFDQEMQQKVTKDLSGGWRMRVAISCALFVTPDILLLDEPTNHLDFPTVMWLERYLQNYEKTLLLVSHDRKFLNSVITDVIHFAYKTLTYYKGDYETFERVRSEQLRCAWKAYQLQQDKIAHATEFINKFRANKKLASMVQSRIKELDKMEKLEKPPEDHKFRFGFPIPEPLAKPQIFDVTDLSFGYDKTKPPLFKNANLSVHLDRYVQHCWPSTAVSDVWDVLAAASVYSVRTVLASRR